MKKIKKKIIEVFSRSFELPSEVTLKLPRITLIGSIHAYIENHDGLVVFSNDKLVLDVYQGRVHITGKNFVLKMMLEHEILLEGDISDVRYEPVESKHQGEEGL
ncbi:sporulation protein YqfC [Gracilibacillus halotolerans]|uniref:Sporulation protein YqfC n=1 Tax=Gracilibacillus halotolerans TaxID=74386 RepID=A0A841RKV3_9BACI|nr:sporulation protein YqfC [Gracilibacillus halotolerans]